MNEDKKIDLKLILSIVATGIMSFSGVVVETAMNVTFPSLMEEFQIGTSSVQWITTGYLLGRLIQGVGTGIALPLMFNITMEQVPEEKLGVMMGTASLITAMVPAVGPSLGGFIVNHFGWRIVFILLCLHAGSNCFPVSAFTSSLHWDKDVP